MACSSASAAASGEEEKKEQRLIDVMLLCDEWKSSKGGLSTFNREFAVNLAEATTGSMKIHCYVSNSDDWDREDAKQYGVNLIKARSVPGSADPLECLKFPPSQLPKPHLVIGHGRKLGCPAYSLVQITKCKWIQFVHVYCEDLGKYKESATAAEDTIEENEEKHKMEIELCKAADAVVAVGSRLQQKYSRRLLNVEVKIITPGIFGKFSSESKLAVDRSVVKNFNVSMFGRAAFEDLSLKGYDLIANAIGSLGKNFELTFVGSSPGEQRKVEQWFLDNTCINRNQLTIRRYCSEQEELKMMFYQSDLVALPSRTEGFGLVALEAISAGVPVLVSGESGIAEALQKVDGGNTVIVGSGENEDEWARRIREMYGESAEEREAKAVKLRENYRKVYSWKAECERFKGLIENVMKTANGGEMNINVDVDDLKPEEQNMQTGMLATESVRCREVQQPRASATSAASGGVSYSQKEDLNALEKKIFLSIVQNYLQTTPPQSPEEHSRFMEYTQKMRLIITGVAVGSLLITVKCESLKILEELWTDYSSGHLGEVVQNCFVTEKILKELNLAELRLKTTMDIEEYNACKMFFEKDALRDALSSEFHTTSSTSESPQKKEQWEKSEQKTKIMETAKLEGASSSEFHSISSTSESPQNQEELKKRKQKTKIVETEKLKGTSPLTVIPTTGHGKELIGKAQGGKGSLHSLPTTDLKEKPEQVFEEIRMLRTKGSFSVLKLPTIDLEKKLAELSMKLQRLRMEGTLPPPELFTADLEDELERLIKLLMLESREGMKDTVFTLRQELEKVKMKALEYAMYPTIRSGLAKFDVNLPEELRSYVGYLFKESAKLGLRRQVFQSPRASEELRGAMDKDELKTFLTIHIREGAWQVVLLFTDELPKCKLPWDWCGIILNKDEDEEVSNKVIYSSTSGILNGWPTHYDPSLVTLCKAITNKDWKVTRLILSMCWIPDKGLKNLSTALTQSELYSLTLYDIGLQSQRLEHLCNALTSVNCRLTNLNVSLNKLGDVGIMHLCNALASVNCTLTSLNVSDSEFGDVGIRHLCNALASVNCRLTSLNVSYIQWGDNGFKHLCDALTSSNCVLTKLKVGFIRLGDGGIKELSEVLTSGFCTLTSLDVSGNKFGDEGIKHLCKALTDTKCKLRSLDSSANWNVTDDGKKYLSQMLTGTDWEEKGALRLSRSTTKWTK